MMLVKVDTGAEVIEEFTLKQRLAKKIKLKARGTLLMSLPDKHQLKFNIHEDAKSLMEAIKKRFRVSDVPSVSAASSKATVSSLPNVDSFCDAVIYSFFASQSNSPQLDNEDLKQINPDDLEEMDLKWQMAMLTMRVRRGIYFKCFGQINPDDLEEMDLKWQMAMLTMRVRRFLKRTGRNLGANGTDTIGLDMSKVECYNCHRKGHFARECRSPRDNRNKEATRRPVLTEVSTSNALVCQCSSSSSGVDNEVALCSKACSKTYATLQTHYDNLTVEFRKSQFDVLSYKIGLESVESRLVVYQQNENVFEEDIKLLKLDVMLRDNALVELRKKYEKAKKERDDLKLNLEKLQTSFKNLKLYSHESDNSMPKSLENDRYKTGEGYHVVPPLYTRTFMPPKPDLVFNDAPNDSESVANVFNVESSLNKPSKDMSKTLRHDAPIIKDWISDPEDETDIEYVPKQKEPSFVLTFEHVKNPRESIKKVEHPKQANNLRTNNQKSRVRMIHPHLNRNVVPTTVLTRSRLVSFNAARPVPTTVSQSTMKSPRPVKHVVNKAHSTIRRPINYKPATKNSNFHKKVTTVKVNKVNVVQGTKGNAEKASANWGNPQQALKDKGVIDSGCSRHMTGNISFLSDFKEINGGYVAFGRNHKGGKILGKAPDENHFLLRVPRENNIYNFDLKNVVPLGDLTCLFAKATLDESNLWHRRLGHINFKTMNKLVKGNLVRGKFDGKANEGFLVGYYVNNKAFRVFNSRTRIVQKTLHINFLENKPNVARIEPKCLFGIDTLNKSMNYQPVVAGNQPNDNADNDVIDVAFDVTENENDIHVSPSGSDKTDNKKHDDKAKRDDKGTSPVVLPTGVRDLRAEFKEFSSNSTNRVNAVSAPVNAAGPNPTNSTNSFNTASPSVNAISPKFGIVGKSSFVDPFKYPDDPDMPELEDIVYSDDEDDVGAEADLSNLETNTHVSPILTTRVHKDHLVNQIIGDLNSAPQTRSMTRYLKGKPHLGLWYPKDSLFNPVAYSDSDYDGASLDRKSTTEGCQFLGCRLISWQCKKQTVVATSSIEAKYVAAASCCAQVLWIQNQLLDYGAKRSAWNEFSCSMASTVICLPTGRKFNFSKYIFDSMVRNVDSPSKFLMYPRFLQVVMDNQVDDLTSHNTKYTSHALTQKVFTNMQRVGKGFSGVETLLFASMLVQPQPQATEEEEEVEMPTAPAPPSPKNALLSPPQAPTPTPYATPPQDQLFTPLALPPQEQPTTTSESSMSLLTTLMETCASLSQKVAELEQDKHTQALEILKLKKRVLRRMHLNREEIEAIDADEDITLVDVEKNKEVVTMDAEPPGRIDQEDFNAASKGVSAAKPTVFDDEEVTMTMAQTLIKLKVEKAKLLDEQMAQRAQVLQKQYDDKEENIDWNVFVEQVQERHLDNIKKYQSLKKKPVSIAQARKNMIIYLKNMARYKMKHFIGMTYDKVRPIFKREYKKVQTLFKPDKDVEEPKKKRVADETLLQESFNKLKAIEVLGFKSTQEVPSNDLKEMYKEDV
nr:uncharacterized mitochondrial protein AtMg00810-like [Tanacetum cinerariifolium]